jgi:DNA-binding transcriptional MocR family regulator
MSTQSDIQSRETPPLYMRLAHAIERQIDTGALQVGDRLPSIRRLQREQGVSVSTILQAYFWLENRGCIEAKPQSGFYVRVPYPRSPREPEFHRTPSKPTALGMSRLLVEVVGAANKSENVPFAVSTLRADMFPNAKLNQIFRKTIQRVPGHNGQYEFPPGNFALRRQIARRSLTLGCSFSPDDILITCGGMEGLNLGLRAVARSGDVIAIESPTYFGILQVIESLGMKAIEIPTYPRNGMCLDALEEAINKHHVKACLAMSNGQNPLGYVLSDERKRDLVALTNRYNVPVIEDDVYGDITYSDQRPRVLRAFDQKDLVITVSSFSKVLGGGLRVGWMEAGRFREQVVELKFINTLASPTLQQMVIAEFIESGGYERNLRRVRMTLADQVHTMRRAVARFFPEDTRVSNPTGGHSLWIELPRHVDAMQVYRQALEQKIGVLPGPIFSATGRFSNFIRLSCGQPLTPETERALHTLSRLCDPS